MRVCVCVCVCVSLFFSNDRAHPPRPRHACLNHDSAASLNVVSLFLCPSRVCTAFHAATAYFGPCIVAVVGTGIDGHSLLPVAASAIMTGEPPAPPPAAALAATTPDATGEWPPAPPPVPRQAAGVAASSSSVATDGVTAETEDGGSTSPSHLVVLCECMWAVSVHQ